MTAERPTPNTQHLPAHQQKLLDQILRHAYDEAGSWREGEIMDLINKIGSDRLINEIHEDSKHVMMRFV